jgi:hypothetical protein
LKIINHICFATTDNYCNTNLNRRASMPIIAVLVFLDYCNRKDNPSTRTYLLVTCCIFSQLHQRCTFFGNMLHIGKKASHRQTIRNERRNRLYPNFDNIYRRKIINIGLMHNLLKYTGNRIQAFGYFRKESEHPWQVFNLSI